jgi:hypothetical protein
MCSIVVAKSGKVTFTNAGTTWLKSLLLFVVVFAARGIAATAAAFGHDLSGHLDPSEIKKVESVKKIAECTVNSENLKTISTSRLDKQIILSNN